MANNPKRQNLGNEKREQIYLTAFGYQKFKGKCADCGKHCVAWWQTYKGRPFRFQFEQIRGEESGSPTTHEFHHIIPIEQDGKTTDENLIFLCARCHRKRHSYIKRAMAVIHGDD